MLKANFILICICIQIFFINCYTINRIQRHPWSNIDEESMDLYITKLLPMNNLFQNESPIGITLDQFDDRQPHLQKRGRQCLWKVCSWALDKRSLSSNSDADIEKLLH